MESKDYNEFLKEFPQSERMTTVAVEAFFEGIGVLLHRKLIDISLVDDFFSSPIKLTWRK